MQFFRYIFPLSLIMSLCLILSAPPAGAVDFKVKGRWIFMADYGKYGRFTDGGGSTGYNNRLGHDDFEMTSRMRVQLDAVASEALSGTVQFEIGKFRWGQASTGGSMGADGVMVKVKHAYIDWMLPETDLKVRMGIQPVKLPSFTTDTQVLGADVAGVVLSYKVNEHLNPTLFWIRPYNDNYTGTGDDPRVSYQDNMDLFSLSVPLTFEGVKITPWAMLGMMGENTIRVKNNYFSGPVPIYYTRNLTALSMGMKNESLTGYGTLFWGGLTGEMTRWNPFRIAWDFNYGSARYDDESASRSGWLASLLLEYKFDWGIPGLYGWYSSGDDDSTSNGSERMPYSDLDEVGYGSFSRYAFFGGRASDDRNSRIGHSMAGTWGVGARLNKISFLQDLTTDIRFNLIGGTNDPGLLKKLHDKTGIWMSPNNFSGENATGMENLYLTTRDTAIEFGVTNNYKIYENLRLGFDFSYMKLFLDKSHDVWGNSRMNGKSDKVCDTWNFACFFGYSF